MSESCEFIKEEIIEEIQDLMLEERIITQTKFLGERDNESYESYESKKNIILGFDRIHHLLDEM